jgi:hypothetical protein
LESFFRKYNDRGNQNLEYTFGIESTSGSPEIAVNASTITVKIL